MREEEEEAVRKAYDRSYKLHRDTGYLTLAHLDADINHPQVLRCVLSVLRPSALLIHFLLLFSFSAPQKCAAEPCWFMTSPGSFIWWHEMHRQPVHMKFLSSSTLRVNCHACAGSSDGNVTDELLALIKQCLTLTPKSNITIQVHVIVEMECLHFYISIAMHHFVEWSQMFPWHMINNLLSVNHAVFLFFL